MLHGIQDGTQSNLPFQQNYQGTNDAQTINSKNAAALDKDLMSVGAFSLDQLMELAGLSVSQAGEFFGVGWGESRGLRLGKVYRVHPPSKGRKILVACGPGNNGKRIVSIMYGSDGYTH